MKAHDLHVRLTCDLGPGPGNPRNSEGAFIRAKNGEIWFAYSRYHADSAHDHAPCDIYMIASRDEGETWSEPRPVATAAEYGVENIMSVSALRQQNGEIGFYYLVKENDCSAVLGRSLTSDGTSFITGRCVWAMEKAYYVVNNDRLVRLADGRILAPAAFTADLEAARRCGVMQLYTTCLISTDDGATFTRADWAYTVFDHSDCFDKGLQEPGVVERADDLYFWMRTGYGCQYDATSADGAKTLSDPAPSPWSSPASPMQIKRVGDVYYMVYNPVPLYNGRSFTPGTAARNPIVIRKSVDGGKTYGKLNLLEGDESRGYCYPAIFGTEDGALLLAYCRGAPEDGGVLCRLGVVKVDPREIE